jgi:hypothetical protein
VPLPSLKTDCGEGYGLAACPTVGLLVTSDIDKNNLSVWRLPGVGASGGPGAGASGMAGVEGEASVCGGGDGLTLVCTLGGAESPPPMQLKFNTGGGRLAFLPATSGSPCPLLLATDAGHDAVHLVDVVAQTHPGYLASPGSIAGPRGVAASGTPESALVAVSAWKRPYSGDHVVVVYRLCGRRCG